MKFTTQSPCNLTSAVKSSLTSTLLGLSMLLTGALVHADVTVTAPEEIDVVAINDQEIRGGLFGGQEKSYKLDAGTHNISVRYKQLFDHRSGEHDVLKSDIVTLNQVQLQDGQNYQLALVGAPSNFDEGKAFAAQPTIGVENAQGQLIAKQTGANSKAKPWLSNGIFGSVMDLRNKDKSQNNVSSQSSMLSNTSTTQNVSAVNVSTMQTQLASSGKAQQLIELWQSATPQERQKFSAWLAEQAAQQ